MNVRPVDQNGDMMPIAYESQMISGAPAVAQVVKQRLNLYFGEWWEDATAGFRIPQFLAEGVRMENLEMLNSYIARYIASTEGISSVDNSMISMEGRRLTYSCTIHVGVESEEVEVDLDGVLSTEY